jgi:hypothetical protein
MIHIEFETENAAFGDSDYTVFQEVDSRQHPQLFKGCYPGPDGDSEAGLPSDQ